MLTYKGVSALPLFRKQQLLKQLKIIQPSIKNISAEYMHFVDSTENLNPKDNKRLKQLLDYGEKFKDPRTKHSIIIIPKIGTISPWSSKATDIARNSELNSVMRIERGTIYYLETDQPPQMHSIANLLYDRMTEDVLYDSSKTGDLFTAHKPKKYQEIDIISGGIVALENINKSLGLALSSDEIGYLFESYSNLNRNPTDVELMMFSVVNSEHCRHKIFNANWVVNGKKQSKSLFKKIKNTYEKNNEGILSAYSDNAAVLKGPQSQKFYPDPKTGTYANHSEKAHIVAKVETHNHPTAVSPTPGAATGIGGEIRDEAATGRGARTKMGLAGFTVSNLNIPGNQQPWEKYYGKPERIVSALDIMVEAPIGGAAFSNEFGRPNLAGYFRTFEQENDNEIWGYHKPIMIAGGTGNIRDDHVIKHSLAEDDLLIILGGPSMLIGLGGGTSSSMQAGESEESLDFSSVQRSNAEMERRAQEVINTCTALGDKNPIITIHDVGAGGVSNALPELVHDSNLGAKFELRKIPSAEPGMSPMEIWCNEAQERYVLGLNKKDLKLFKSICERERCPFAEVGVATNRQQLVLKDRQFNNTPIDIPMSLLFGKPPKMTRKFKSSIVKTSPLSTDTIPVEEAAQRVLQMPSVGSKKFLITIGDRSVGGLTIRDQMVGPWQVPVADVAVTASSFGSKTGEAMAVGERTPLALINGPASARMAVGEAITNIAAAPINKISDVKLSANWMAAAGYGNQDEKLYEAVSAIGEDFCPGLGVTIPVGKDSLSMRTTWLENQSEKSVSSPLSLIVTGFAPVNNTGQVLTPYLHKDWASSLILIDLGESRNRLGGSALAQAYNQVGDKSPDIQPRLLKSFFKTIQKLNNDGLLLAYHDRSDGGLFTTLCEMAFAGRTGLDIDLANLKGSVLEVLFNEELGAVIQIKKENTPRVLKTLEKNLGKCVYNIGSPTKQQITTIRSGDKEVISGTRADLESLWAKTSYLIQSLRDNPDVSKQEYDLIKDVKDPGITPKLTFSTKIDSYSTRPKVAILREQGVNGQTEMAAAFSYAGFEAMDVHINDLESGKYSLKEFFVLAACGGFSYGDVLGAGMGWAKSILNHPKLKQQFKTFFERPDTLSLGVCNGCQMLSGLKEIIPGAEKWPEFKKNTSEQFEARLVSVRVNKTKSILFKDMEGSILPISVAHGEGRVEIKSNYLDLVPLQYVNNYGTTTEDYPLNPNGSTKGATSFTSSDGRATILMPHPERGFLTSQFSWHPPEWEEKGPWLKIFQNARQWVEENKLKR